MDRQCCSRVYSTWEPAEAAYFTARDAARDARRHADEAAKSELSAKRALANAQFALTRHRREAHQGSIEKIVAA